MSHRKNKEKLWHENPHCHWCGVLTVLDCRREWRKPASPPENLATLDHLFSRYHIERWKRFNGQRKRVLSCLKCNHERARQEDLSMSREELIKRSYGYSLVKLGHILHQKGC